LGEPLVFFGFAAELGQGEDGDAELAGEGLDGAADLGDFDLAVFGAAAAAAHELEVVDDDQVERVALGLVAAGLAAHFEDAHVGGVVDEERGLAEHLGGVLQLGEFGAREEAGAQAGGVDLAGHAEQSLNELFLGHFEAEEDAALALGGGRYGRPC
jgi:hypothetical protein